MVIGTRDDGSGTVTLGFLVVLPAREAGLGPNILFEVSTSHEVIGQLVIQLFSRVDRKWVMDGNARIASSSLTSSARTTSLFVKLLLFNWTVDNA